jgi:membrane associated rhomboid family serine protease
MQPQSPYSAWRATATPIREIVAITGIATLVAPILELLFHRVLGVPGPQTLAILSPIGASHLWLWQSLTTLFVHGFPGAGISFNLLVELLFHLYVIWALGSNILERIGARSFLKLYLGAGVGAGIVATLLMRLTGMGAVLGGSTPALLAILMVWTMFYPTAQMLLFFIIPIQARWIAGGAAMAITLVDLSQGAFIDWAWSMSGMTAGYVTGVLAWGLTSPFPQTHHFDRALSRWWKRMSSATSSSGSSAKIVDIRTGKPIAGDDPFVDAMLEKISKHGEGSLTIYERIRLYWATRHSR